MSIKNEKNNKKSNGKSVKTMKKIIGVGSPVPVPNAANPEMIKSEVRMEKLVQSLYDAVNKSGEEIEGFFTHYEITDAFLRVAHSYNQRALKSQFENVKS